MTTSPRLVSRASAALPASLLGAQVVALAALRLRDPHVPGSWGGCPFLALTGLPCPFCGGLRALNDLTRADLAGAVSSNAVMVLATVLALVATVAWTAAAWRAARRGEPDPVAIRLEQAPVGRWVAAALLLWCAFGVLRWWGPLAWLQP
ncbi:DUF2752 domain-containing protein [Arsenicicoccus sp. oral taxon 190]|uniref:DUF2752 domain-containing protein n=1 Tax=Arsenicicoccus sp. oral taxon 190 TaxID=1658671 RepID=UPI00067C2242|nr:DUF2752 domain-containing protein [Arsenicicoccus sp. oral taxon 190]